LIKYRSLLNEKLALKDIFFSPKSEFNQKFRLHMIDKTPKLMYKKLEGPTQNQFFQFNNKANLEFFNNNINKNKTNSINSSEVEFLDRIIQTINTEKDLSKEYYEKHPYKLSQLISLVHFTIYIFFQNKNSNNYSETLNKIFSILFICLMKKLTIVENILSLKDSKEKARMKVRIVINQMTNAINNNKEKECLSKFRPKTIKDLENLENSENMNFNNSSNNNSSSNNVIYKTIIPQKKSSNLISLRNESNNLLTSSNTDKNASFLNSFNSNPMLSIPSNKKDSMNSIIDMIDLTKSKLMTKRNLNTKLDSTKKNYLFSLTSKNLNNKDNDCKKLMNVPLIRKQSSILPNQSFVKAVSSELKNLTKFTKEDFSEKNYFNVKNVDSNPIMVIGDNLNNKKNNISENNNKNSNNNLVKNNSNNNSNNTNNTLDTDFRKMFFNSNLKENKNLTQKKDLNIFNKKTITNTNKIPNSNNKNSPYTINMASPNKTNTLSEHDIINSTNILSTPSYPNKNSGNQVRKSLFDKTASPFVLNFNINNIINSNSNIKSSGTLTDNLTNENIEYPNEQKKVSEIDILNEHIYSMIGEDSYSYLDNSEISFSKEAKKYKNENNNFNEMDEVDSQFDEMIELMDDLQLSDTYKEEEYENSPVEKKNKNVKISDFKFVMEISSGGYGRVDLYKKIYTGDLYAIKTVDINKMVFNIF